MAPLQSTEPEAGIVLPQPPVRLAAEALMHQAEAVEQDAMLITVLEAFPGPAAIVNDRRQIVAANRSLIDACGGKDVAAALLGQRLGDALGCIESHKGADGCGSAAACAYCGAGRHFEVMEREPVERVQSECLVCRWKEADVESLEFTLVISRLPDGWNLVALQDISGEKRRQVLERCFFHDVMNYAGGIQGLAKLMEEEHGDETGLLSSASDALMEELRYHQMLLAAESGTYRTQIEDVDLRSLAEEVRAVVGNHAACGSCDIAVHGHGQWRTDRVLLRRVVINLVKNACEATRGVGVEISLTTDGQEASIKVGNPGEMSAEVQAQVFKRSFSTKGVVGRGVGTWSVRLLTESYLGGRVDFHSAEGRTVFHVQLPLVASS